MQPAGASPPSTSSTAPLGRPALACRLRSTILPPPASTAGSTCQAGTTSDEQAPALRALTALRGPSSRPCATREVGTLFSPPRGGCTRSVATTPALMSRLPRSMTPVPTPGLLCPRCQCQEITCLGSSWDPTFVLPEAGPRLRHASTASTPLRAPGTKSPIFPARRAAPAQQRSLAEGLS